MPQIDELPVLLGGDVVASHGFSSFRHIYHKSICSLVAARCAFCWQRHDDRIEKLPGGPREYAQAMEQLSLCIERRKAQRPALEALRQPLEDGFGSVSRAAGRVVFPARFMLIATMNLCPCGGRGDPAAEEPRCKERPDTALRGGAVRRPSGRHTCCRHRRAGRLRPALLAARSARRRCAGFCQEVSDLGRRAPRLPGDVVRCQGSRAHGRQISRRPR